MSGFDAKRPTEAVEALNKLLGPTIDVFLTRANLSQRQREALGKAKEGMPIAAILGIDRAQRDALFVRACYLFHAGKTAEAHNLLTFLYMLQPVDARVIYALGLTLQVSGALREATQFFLFFIALDATNAEGHLRMAECFVGLRDYDEARGYLHAAARLATTERQRFHAAQLSILMERTAQPNGVDSVAAVEPVTTSYGEAST